MFQRTHLTTHLISEYTFTQTTGSSSSSENNARPLDEAVPNDEDDLPTVIGNSATIQHNTLVEDQEKPVLSPDTSSSSAYERPSYGSTDVV